MYHRQLFLGVDTLNSKQQAVCRKASRQPADGWGFHQISSHPNSGYHPKSELFLRVGVENASQINRRINNQQSIYIIQMN